MSNYLDTIAVLIVDLKTGITMTTMTTMTTMMMIKQILKIIPGEQ